jgi:hypothetical protein
MVTESLKGMYNGGLFAVFMSQVLQKTPCSSQETKPQSSHNRTTGACAPRSYRRHPAPLYPRLLFLRTKIDLLSLAAARFGMTTRHLQSAEHLRSLVPLRLRSSSLFGQLAATPPRAKLAATVQLGRLLLQLSRKLAIVDCRGAQEAHRRRPSARCAWLAVLMIRCPARREKE